MKLVRVEIEGVVHWGSVAGDGVTLLERGEGWQFKSMGKKKLPPSTRLLPPIQPSKIVCVARNYADHAAEMGSEPPREPRFFLKAPSAVIGHGDPIRLPPGVGRCAPEGELAVVIARRCKDLTRDDALSAVLGYTLVNDITARDLQIGDDRFGRAKNFDTFCPLGPWIDTDLNASDLTLELMVNGEPRISTRTSKMIFDVETLLVWITSIMTLEPGDVVSTGTPAGAGLIEPGDTVEVLVEGLGTLRNPVI